MLPREMQANALSNFIHPSIHYCLHKEKFVLSNQESRSTVKKHVQLQNKINSFTIIIFHLHTLNTFNLCKPCKHDLCNFYLFLFFYFCLIKIDTIFLLSHSLLCLIFANTTTHITVYLLDFLQASSCVESGLLFNEY